ncbi:MAG: membrane protein insertion efficiency factor YidD [Omnitrophica bacterium RIFCSPLOWO2_12_FULL_44_17]|uniref:Putative membrane protein insertion efficiency factor n=1 Tax=Candidatus Danuiimicrobium aquiferis TaxID=1801832 RepID=A0A1G1L1F8_9BACT|nr:MAG: membrane protein insertion efficiency factor YidD [Omnitrophica bacterium RIFCSPHIGHO2_02_FULL_45_28]OGW90010.1 MAG: membrane protein insertion efficiency factor YidD [Omnitrophica bacterium RIFCSPHIGHO2_12_FULL_44_12]OGW98976.1 MAG: membrane protein insertion efficiency factor YidD [Omnitrophica bacterium RIFCSPLOWO2_12_FULL_44_17]OGX01598.1 MAG: membrane protein insertion efficiency factor YidD [Omnitrophica bacterium RIFCSPLOWO2_02_FULL_44_11]
MEFWLKQISRKTIGFYRIVISPWIGCHCRFYPTCSQYATDAIDEYGFLKGIFKTGIRLLKCQPFHKGGYDPVEQGLDHRKQ